MPLLHWLTRDDDIKATTRTPYRLLEEVREFSHGDRNTGNMLIQGDNLDALKALLPYYAGKVKCIFIDPPYNTKSAFEHYDDNLEHTKWLAMMYPRLEMLRSLLSEDGSMWVTIDDNEAHYLKVIMDEIFGRANFVNQISAKMKQTAGASGGGEDKKLKKNIEYLLVYAKNYNGSGGFKKFNDVYDEEDLFELIDEMRDEGKSWKYTRVLKSLGTKEFVSNITDGAGEPIKIFRHNGVVMEPITYIMNAEGISERDCYIKYFDKIFRDTNAQSSIRTRVMEAVAGHGDFFSIEYMPRSGKNKGRTTRLYYKGQKCDLIAWLSDVAVKKGSRLLKLEKTGTYWEGFPLNNLTNEGGVQFPQSKKPEALIHKVIELSTQLNDLVLDSFGGSGTTGAVAHKMGRRWIMVELGEHSHTHIIPRLKKVIAGEDSGGITEAVGWKGGGGFRFYRLGVPVFDESGHVSKGITFAPLAAHIWFIETGIPFSGRADATFLGSHEGVGYYLLYNGILGDKRPNGGNVLTAKMLSSLPPHNGAKVIFGEGCRLSAERLNREGITFRQIPYEIRAR
ncbi:site-specific DNA-methyltransferase [Candidatus Magnetomonas plexicatena]|uniref:site-specific DNA-methyltransferase n=1 Tax=Candidatus Magnetomonas plexicatena TaxID=2552947 RepID=UPI001C7712C8|nr:site-specific DNA-methyltransferase [Nitrospirales bacterium LBB_01]